MKENKFNIYRDNNVFDYDFSLFISQRIDENTHAGWHLDEVSTELRPLSPPGTLAGTEIVAASDTSSASHTSD